MHTNVHFTVGILFASIAHRLFSINIWFFLIIIVSAAIADFDMVASKIAVNNDHRNFFTHSIYPAVILLAIGIPVGFIWNIHMVWISGIGYASHIFLDCIDWKTRLFYGKKQFGWAFLITEDEKNLGKSRKQLQIESKMDFTSFFVYRYFHSMGMLVLGITLTILSFLLLFVFASEYWYVFFGYFVLLEIPLYQKKKMEEKYDDYKDND
ncbi:MAG: metal-dependent hydrolase [Promethearchaeota archaeon]